MRPGNNLKFIPLCLGKLAITQIMVDSLFENSLYIFLLVLAFRVVKKVLSLGNQIQITRGFKLFP